MFRLALHWQILIGMVAGSLIGLGLNFTLSTRSVTVTDGLPTGISQATISDSSERTEIVYVDADEQRTERIVDPIDQDPEVFRTLDDLKNADPLAVSMYLQHGQSVAKKVGGWFKKIGGLFLRMLQMVAVPLIVTSLLTGILGLGAGDGVGRMFRRTFFYYLSTSFLAIVTGLLVVNIIRPGLVNAPDVAAATNTIAGAASLSDTMFNQLMAIIPSNPLAALVAPNFLSIIAFTIAFGLFTIRVGGQTAERIQSVASDGFEVIMAMTMAIIRLAPIGVFFLIAYVTATQGAGVFRSLGWYVLAVTLALLIHATITLPLILRYVAKRSPLEFARAMSPALLTAFSSASSNGTLPITMSSVEQRAGISNKTGSFVLPLGATVNMDGTALYEAIAVLFIAQLHFGYNLPLSQQIVVALTALLASIGAAGIPHAGLVMMVIVLQAVGLPLEMQGVILAVDRVLDMARTSVNVWSDSCGCAVVEQLEQNTPSP
jgi:proton glutamate symport protein